MYTEVNGKKRANGVLFSLLVWLLSLFCCLTVLFIFGANDELPIKQRAVYPYVAFLAKYTDKACFKEMELELRKYSWIPQAFRLESKLTDGKDTIDSYTDLTSVNNLYCYFMHKEAVDKVNKDYEKAADSLKAWHRGDAVPPSPIVQETSEQIQELTDKLMKTQITNLSKPQLYSKTLALILLHAGTFFEYKIDAVGADTEKYSKNSSLFINGYMRFKPGDFIKDFERYVDPFDFSYVRDHNKHNLAIFLLEKDDGSGTTFWGDKSQFDITQLYEWLGFEKIGNSIHDMYSAVELAPENSILIRCSRLYRVSGSEFDTIIVDLRPQEWCKWNIVQKSVAENVFTALKSARTLSAAKPERDTSKAPVNITPGHAAAKYVFFDKASGIAPETAVAVNMPVTKIFAKKGNKPASRAASSPVVQQIMQAALTPEEKEAASQKKITEGKKVEETGDYVGAYRLYKQAADMGNDKGRLNCAILLVQNNVTYTNNQGADISLEVARQFAEETVKKTKSKEFKAIAYNILGIIFNSGGQGVWRNVPLAIKYFEQGAALGDKNAKKNLEDLRKQQ